MDEPLDVEQRDHEGIELRAIPVKVENFVTTRELPAKRATMDTFYPSKTEPIMLQGADPRIKRLIIQVGTQPVWVGTATSINALLTQGAGTAGAGCFQMSANIQCPPWEGINEDLWVLGVNSGAIVSLRREYWSDI